MILENKSFFFQNVWLTVHILSIAIGDQTQQLKYWVT